MISPQLLQQRLRQRPQLLAGAAAVYGVARLEHVAQLAEDYALRVTTQRRQRHRGARAPESERTDAPGIRMVNVVEQSPVTRDPAHDFNLMRLDRTYSTG